LQDTQNAPRGWYTCLSGAQLKLNYFDSPDPAELLGFAQRELIGLETGTSRETICEIRDVVTAAVAAIHDEAARNRTLTGLFDLDDLTGGLHDPGLTIVAARPHMGKTAFATTLLTHIAASANKDRPAIMFSLEMDEKMISLNLLATYSGIPLDLLQPAKGTLFSEEMDARLTMGLKRVKAMNLVVIPDSYLTPQSLRARTLRALAERHVERPSIIVIDYLQLMDTSAVAGRNTNREREVAYLGQSAKRLAMELRCPVLAVAQLNRGVEGRPDKRPRMSDLRESGSLEQDADAVWLLHVPGYYDTDPECDKTEAEIIVPKNRQGRSGFVPAVFHGEYARWANRARPGW